MSVPLEAAADVSRSMRVSIIVAWAEDRVIGRGSRLPWHLPDDLKHFKRLTMGHHLIVGRRTWESIGRALPGRKMMVVSRGRPKLPAEVELMPSLSGALSLAASRGETEAFVAGGARLYSAALPRAERIYLTRIDAAVDGDIRFPGFDWGHWCLTGRDEHPADDRHAYPFRFEIWDRERL
ncbi:MAG: dihydrofolate reductase [Thermoanaerobaculia bacterium]